MEMAVVVKTCLRIYFFSYLVTPPTLVATVTRKMKYLEHFYFFINDTLHKWIFLKSN